MFIVPRTSSINLLRRLPNALQVRPSRSIIRKNSSKSRTLPQGTVTSHLFAGALGGFVVIVGGYIWYHFSALKPIVETSKRVRNYAEEAKKGFAENFRGRVIELLRKTAKAYVAVVPGAEVLVDTAFDSLEGVIKQHREEVDRIAAKALEEIQKLVENGMNGIQTALAVLDILRIRLGTPSVLRTIEEKAAWLRRPSGGGVTSSTPETQNEQMTLQATEKEE
ncbi:hypothetical protein C0995_016027 [Termitomyces sp. Mi166|nr:hypothetical protein C0995_016027 [Termitomyces sp. Mi166\